MEKKIQTYGIKEIQWKFDRNELEQLLRDELSRKKEIKAMYDYQLQFDWAYDDHGNVTGVAITKTFKQKEEGE